MVFVLNKLTVSPAQSPYLWTSAVLSCVAFVLTSSQLSRSFVAALTYPASVGDCLCLGWLYSGEYGPSSNAHSQVVMFVGTTL